MTRFAPTPSGRMHLGNVFSAMLAWLSEKKRGGEVLLRIEDLDPARSRPEYIEAILSDFSWLGLTWDRRAPDQSTRSHAYAAALQKLDVYPCYCTRDELAASAPHASDGRAIYPGTCRNLPPDFSGKKSPCLRVRVPDQTSEFVDGLLGRQTMNLQRDWGDFIVRRADGVAAYQLAVVVDDGEEGVDTVVRGRDLLDSTHVQRYLYGCLGLTPPEYCHVPMLLAPDGRRLSKRDRDLDLGCLRTVFSPAEILGFLAHACGLIDREEPVSAQELTAEFSWDKISPKDIVVDAAGLLHKTS